MSQYCLRCWLEHDWLCMPPVVVAKWRAPCCSSTCFVAAHSLPDFLTESTVRIARREDTTLDYKVCVGEEEEKAS